MAYNFPDAPTVGQAYSGYVYDGEKWLAIAGAPNQSGVISIQRFTSSGTYTPSSNMTTCVIECVGGGGGGGGLTGGATYSISGGGGGSGSYSKSTKTAAQIGTSQAVTIGTGGASATAGTATTFGSILTANGGLAGGGNGDIGAGGAVGTGDLTVAGTSGGGGIYITPALTVTTSGSGGSSFFGGGARGVSIGTSLVAAGVNGSAGGGGSGAATSNLASAAAGGRGGDGLVVITEYGMIALSSSNAQGMVRFDLPQSLTANQTAQARANIWVTKKNYIIDGGMMISQENGTTAGTTHNYYPVDTFRLGMIGTTGVPSIRQVVGKPNRIRVSVTTADAAVAAGDLVNIQHVVEGLRCADLLIGTSSAKTITLQFGVKAPAGTYSVVFRNSPSDRSYVAEYVVAAGEANIDVIKSVTFTLDTSGTWASDNSAGIIISWALMVGSSFQTPAGVWTAGSLQGSPNQFNLMGTNGNVFELFDVSLTEGSVAPPFQLPDYAAELALCGRYFQYHGSLMLSGYHTAGGIVYNEFMLSPAMRAAPTATWTAPGYSNMSGLSVNTTTVTHIRMQATMTVTGAGYAASSPYCNARL